MMPYLDGAATIRALRKIDPSLKIVRISGAVESGATADHDRGGDDRFLAKPFSGAQLLEAVNAALRA